MGVGVFRGVRVGALVGAFVAWEEDPVDFDPGNGNERHPAETRQAASSRAMSMKMVDFRIELVFSPDLLIDAENIPAPAETRTRGTSGRDKPVSVAEKFFLKLPTM